MMIPWGGVSCCLSATALYLLGRSSWRDAYVLRTVTRVNQLQDLAQLLDTASKMLPLVVTISGRVCSDTPINCEYSGMRGVIVDETAEQHFLKHNDAGSWIQDSALMLSMCKEVPWYLDDGTGRVFVTGARGASGLALTVGSEVFEESGRSLVRGTLDYLQGLKMLGVKRTERVLPIGTPLTVVGEAVKDDIGTIRIQRPRKGPFYVSPKAIDQLIANLGKWARWYKYASLGFQIFGVYLIAKHGFQYVMERKRHWELRKRVLDAATRRQGPASEGSDTKADDGLDATKKDRLMLDLCVICLEQEYNSVFVPCGHMCCCTACSSHLTNCPLCRRLIEQMIDESLVSLDKPKQYSMAKNQNNTNSSSCDQVRDEDSHSLQGNGLAPMTNIPVTGTKHTRAVPQGYGVAPVTSNVSIQRSVLKKTDKFSNYIKRVKNKMRTASNIGVPKVASKADDNVTGDSAKVTSRPDSFNDNITSYIRQAKKKIRRSSSVVGNEKIVTFK